MFLLSIAAILLTAAQVTGVAHPAGVSYTLSPIMQSGQLKAIDVELEFIGENDGETELLLPDRWGGESDLWRGLTQFRIDGAESVTTGGNPARRFIRHAPAAKLTVRYRLKQFWRGEPDGVEYRPVVRPSYFHILGWTALAQPKWRSDTPASVSFKSLSRSWQLASDLEHGNLTLKKVLQSVAVGGDFRVLKARALRMAIRGTWTFKDENVLAEIEPIVASHYRFWGDPPSAYLVTLLPMAPRPNSMSAGGTGLGDAFAFYATPNMEMKVVSRRVV